MRPSIRDALAASAETIGDMGEDPSRHLLGADPWQRDNRTTLNSIAPFHQQVKTLMTQKFTTTFLDIVQPFFRFQVLQLIKSIIQ